MELYNLNSQHSIVVPVGEPIAQMVFLYTLPVESDYSHHGGKYQAKADDNLDKLMANWRPPAMFAPGLSRSNRRRRPNPVEYLRPG